MTSADAAAVPLFVEWRHSTALSLWRVASEPSCSSHSVATVPPAFVGNPAALLRVTSVADAVQMLLTVAGIFLLLVGRGHPKSASSSTKPLVPTHIHCQYKWTSCNSWGTSSLHLRSLRIQMVVGAFSLRNRACHAA